MSRFTSELYSAAIVAICIGTNPVHAAAPLDEASGPAAVDLPVRVDPLDKEIVVRNWVLCVSQAFAEQLVRARERGVEEAYSTYADLSDNRYCGRFSELSVILRERLYTSPTGEGQDAGVFAAEIRMADDWAGAFVVYGGLPE